MAEISMEVAFPELELVDSLILKLETLLTEADETPLRIDAHDTTRRAVYRAVGAATRGPSERRAHHADAVYLDEKTLVLRCQDTQVVKQTPLQVRVQAEKSGRGEVVAIFQGKVRDIKRVRGGYDIYIDLIQTKKLRLTPTQKLREHVMNGDPGGWNRWCHDITGTIELMGVDLRALDLSGFDLCCADLTGADLSNTNLSGAILAGAVLSNCNLERVTAIGTDFFHARMTRAQAVLLQQSGMPEVESVVFEAARERTRVIPKPDPLAVEGEEVVPNE